MIFLAQAVGIFVRQGHRPGPRCWSRGFEHSGIPL